jgi:hypothetical protein
MSIMKPKKILALAGPEFCVDIHLLFFQAAGMGLFGDHLGLDECSGHDPGFLPDQ